MSSKTLLGSAAVLAATVVTQIAYDHYGAFPTFTECAIEAAKQVRKLSIWSMEVEPVIFGCGAAHLISKCSDERAGLYVQTAIAAVTGAALKYSKIYSPHAKTIAGISALGAAALTYIINYDFDDTDHMKVGEPTADEHHIIT